jgi:radical SAM protein with 4Fe4S-binding SPASM domain
VISKKNYHEIGKLITLAEKLGVNAIYFQPLELVGIEERSEVLVGDLTYEVLSQELNRALEVSQHHQVQTNLKSLLQKLPLYWNKYQMEMHSQDPRICILPWFSSYITVDGDVRPCCSFSQTRADMGNILTTSMTEIWNGEPYQYFREAMREGRRPYPICENCVPQTLGDIVKSSGILPGFLK